jgi:hypothetical protein
MALSRRDDVVVGLVLLHHQPHRAHVVARIAPVACRIEITQQELVFETECDRRSPVRDLPRQELQGAARGLVVVEDAGARVEPVSVAVRARAEVRIRLRDSVRRHRRERRLLRLRRFGRVAEDLRRRRLVEADARVDDPDRLEQGGRADGGELGGLHRLLPRRGHERGCREVVDLDRARRAKRLGERRLVEEIGLVELDPFLDGVEVLVARCTGPDEARHLIALLEQELGEQRPVLSSDTGDQSPPHATIVPVASA